MKPDTRDIIRRTCWRHLVHPDEIFAPVRGDRIDAARTDAIRAVKAQKPHLSSTQLGQIFKRHHTTILNALGRTKRWRAR